MNVAKGNRACRNNMQPLSGCDGVLPFRARRPIIVNGEMVLGASGAFFAFFALHRFL